jgi:hypothetical protein
MEWVEAESIFRTTSPIEVPIPGKYVIDVIGKTNKHEGEPTLVEGADGEFRPIESESYDIAFPVEFELFRLAGAELIVFPVTPFQIEILSPEPGENLGPAHQNLIQGGFTWPLKINPIPIEVRIVDEDGNALPEDLNQILVNHQSALTAAVAGYDSTQITLRPEASSPGYFTGEITEFEGEGPRRIIFSLESEYDERYRPLSRTTEVEFTRIDGVLQRGRFYQSMFWIAISLIVLRIGICFISNRNPVSGDLVFYDGMTELCTYNLGVSNLCGKNKRTISNKELALYLQLGLKKITAKNQKSLTGRKQGKQSFDDEGMFFAESTDTGHPGITMKVWPDSADRPYTLDLAPNVQTSFGGSGGIQVKYIP